MKKSLIVIAGALLLAAIAWVQTTTPVPRAMPELMPGGPLIYLEAKDFHSVLSEWNQSGVKQQWLASANYQVFTNSNLLQKLDGLYQEYGGVAGFLPGLPGTLEVAGRESALGLYDLREQQFVYITKIEESALATSQLWRLRDKFSQRQTSGITFYVRRDDASKRTVAFAFTGGYLVVATRDDLIARTLGFIAAGKAGEGSLASEPWFASALREAGSAGELRLALNMPKLLANESFRSYWIQRNASELRPFAGSIADVQRAQGRITESRVFIRNPEQIVTAPGDDALAAVAALRGLVAPESILARAWAAPSPDSVQALIEGKLLAPVATGNSGQYAPGAVSTDETAGSEQDLETRIDEPPLPVDVTGSLKSGALRDFLTAAMPEAMLQIQASAETEHFIRAPSVIVFSGSKGWDAAQVREALSSAVETLWTTSRLGVGWQAGTAGRHAVEQLDGLASLQFAIDGKLLFIANDATLLASTLDRIGTAPATAGPAYVAEVRHAAARADYERLMQALDFGGRAQSFVFNPQGDRTPPFFSGNLASLSGTLGFIRSALITQVEAPTVRRQTIVYQ